MLPVTTRRSLPMSLLRARERVMQRFRPMLERHGVTEQQWRVIRVLSEETPLGASEVARRAAILGPSLTRIVRTLEARGLVTREARAQDARYVDLAITAAGRRLIGAAMKERQKIYRDIERLHGRRKLEALLDLLEALIEREEASG